MYWSHSFVYMNMTHDNYSHEISAAFFFSHNFSKKFSWGQNKWSWLRTKHTKTIQQQYNLLFKPLQIPFTLTLRLWDIFILEGEKILTGMAYNIIKLHRSKWNTIKLDLYLISLELVGRRWTCFCWSNAHLC